MKQRLIDFCIALSFIYFFGLFIEKELDGHADLELNEWSVPELLGGKAGSEGRPRTYECGAVIKVRQLRAVCALGSRAPLLCSR